MEQRQALPTRARQKNIMEQRRKIIIPTGKEPLETPHFDEEETLLSARPVVPLKPGTNGVKANNAPHRVVVPVVAAEPRPKKTPVLALVIVAAVGIGIAAGFAIARYQTGRKSAAVPVASEPTAAAPKAETTVAQKPKPLESVEAPSVPAEKETQQTEPEVIPASDKKPEPSAQPEASDKPAERDRQTRDKDLPMTTPPIVPREKPRADKRESDQDQDQDEQDKEDRKRERREQRREQRRRERDDNDDSADLPGRMRRRAGEQVNRIREIFEGREP